MTILINQQNLFNRRERGERRGFIKEKTPRPLRSLRLKYEVYQ